MSRGNLAKFIVAAIPGAFAAILMLCGAASDWEAEPVATPSALGHAMRLDEHASGRKITLEKGEYVIVSLPANRTTGYSWNIATHTEPSVLKPVDSAYEVPANAKPGQGGRQVYTFEAHNAGADEIYLVYMRPWENADPARKFTLFVTVK